MTKILILITSLILLNPSLSFANSPPQLISPQNNSTVSSNKLEWQAPSYTLYPTSPYRVQVDEEISFANPFRDYYTKNTYYSPTLTLGTWYWRVKAKDDQGIWSEWSEIWSFNYSAEQTPVPTQSETTPLPTSSPSPTSQDSLSNEFLISDVPENINSDQNFTIKIDLLLSKYPDSNFYLKGAFIKEGGSNYFGLTKVGGSWIKNSSSYSSQKLITTNSLGEWSGSLEVMVDSEDSGFKGSGDYIFKVGRYTESGSGPTWSNQVNINIKEIASSRNEDANTPSPTSINKSTKSTPSPSIKKSEGSFILAKASPKRSALKISSVAGVATESSVTSSAPAAVKGQTHPNYYLIAGGIITLILGIGSFVFFLKRH